MESSRSAEPARRHGIARRWSKTAELLLVDGHRERAATVLDDELTRCEVTSRVDSSSEMSRCNREDGSNHLNDDLLDFLCAARAGVELSGGLVDLTVGAAMVALGEDVDSTAITETQRGSPFPTSRRLE